MSSTSSQPPSYGARGHTQDIIDLLGGGSSSGGGGGGGGGGIYFRQSSLDTRPSATSTSLSGASAFWTSAQSSSQGAFANANAAAVVTAGTGATIKTDIKSEKEEEAIKNLAEQGAVALALASPRRASTR